MDTKELLGQVVDGIVSEDNATAEAAFKQYAQAKVKSLIAEGSAAPAKEEVEEVEVEDENKDETDAAE